MMFRNKYANPPTILHNKSRIDQAILQTKKIKGLLVGVDSRKAFDSVDH